MPRLHERLSRRDKALVLLLSDGLWIVLALWVALQLRLGQLWPVQYFPQGVGLFLLMPAIGMALSWVMGLPRIVLRAFEDKALTELGKFALYMSVICAALNATFLFGLPRSIPGIWAAVFLFLAVGGRLAMLWAIRMAEGQGPRKNVVIYGAGSAGQQLMAALKSSPELHPVGYVDDNLALRKVQVSGLRVYPPADLPRLIAEKGVAQVILAMPSVAPDQRRRIMQALKGLSVEVMTLPSFVELLNGRSLRDQLRPVTLDDLLGRDAVDLSSETVTTAYTGKTVLVSGAGGSIGSELCRQILAARPARLILFEQNEYALYAIDMELQDLAAGVEIVPILGSVIDRARLDRTLAVEGVQIILHAAAYKHVPLVEANGVAGVRNNVIGTQTLADAALAAGVERFILVSTDKAVRPTNVMGATKRMAELVIQDRQHRSRGTVFAMVRFGNVLGSSGSVVPLFQKQIAAGGPVTLTHREVTRYFMTIPEAAQLVLLAGSFAEGGEVFVLDMGKPVRIAELARSLIELSGLTVREDGADGDIEIQEIGLRPGEKLYEELLIGSDTIDTPHPKILRAIEGQLSELETAAALKELSRAVEAGDDSAVRAALTRWVDGYAAPGPGGEQQSPAG